MGATKSITPNRMKPRLRSIAITPSARSPRRSISHGPSGRPHQETDGTWGEDIDRGGGIGLQDIAHVDRHQRVQPVEEGHDDRTDEEHRANFAVGQQPLGRVSQGWDGLAPSVVRAARVNDAVSISGALMRADGAEGEDGAWR